MTIEARFRVACLLVISLCGVSGAATTIAPSRAVFGQAIQVASGAAQPASPEAPMRVLTDTPEYCAKLEARITSQPNRPSDVRVLLRQGHLLCDHGQVREGIAHLRRALLILKHKNLTVVAP